MVSLSLSLINKKQNPMQMNFRRLPLLVLTVLICFTACKKEDTPKDQENEIATHSEDQNYVSNEMDALVNEANIALENDASFSGKMMGQQDMTNICGAVAVSDTTSNPRTITITYNGNNCFSTHHRTGTVTLSMPAGMRWKNPGAVLTITIHNLKIKRLSDNKSITINGTHTITNETGGLLIQLPNLNQIIHKTSGNLSISFGDNTQRTWQVSRKRTYTYNNGVVLTITGTHTDGNNTQIAEWGTNRFGNSFTTSISQPLVFRQDCLLRLTSGQVTHQGFATATVTFGLDSAGNPTACPGAGNYYYKLNWTGPNGNTHDVILPY